MAIEVDKESANWISLIALPLICCTFPETTSNDVVHSKIGRLCIYYSHKKTERLLEQKDISKKHYWFPHLLFVPFVYFTHLTVLCI